MTRHQRRKAAIARQTDKLEHMAGAERARRIADIVSANLSNPHRAPASACKISSIYERGLHRK